MMRDPEKFRAAIAKGEQIRDDMTADVRGFQLKMHAFADRVMGVVNELDSWLADAGEELEIEKAKSDAPAPLETPKQKKAD